MADPILLVLSRASAGREAEMLDWYTGIHQPDALRFRGSTTAQVFTWNAEQPQFADREEFGWHFMALYDTTDPGRWSAEHIRYFGTEDFMVSTAVDAGCGMNEVFYHPLQVRDNAPEDGHRGCVILEQMNPSAGQESAFERWYNDEYLPQAMRRPGVKSGGLYAWRPGVQMIPALPRQRYVGVYRTEGAAALAGWRNAARLEGQPCIDPASIAVTHWDAANERLTKDQVLHPTAGFLAAQEAARARMGSGYYQPRVTRKEAWEKAAVPRRARRD
jgi:hypothetical protein